MRVLRGAWSRRAPLLTLLAVTAVAVAGTLATLGFAAATGVTGWVVAPLLLIGAVAVPSLGAELAQVRREEIAVARLRGLHGPRLTAFLLAEPALAVVAGLALGLAAGVLGARVATATWEEGLRPEIGARGVALGCAVALGGLLVLALSTVRAVREPLGGQIAGRARPGAAGTLALFGAVLTLVAAVVAVVRRRGADPGGSDVLVQAAPALIGLAVAVLALALLSFLARVAVRATTNRSLAPFLASRRLARSIDLVPGVRVAVAAAVVGALAASAAVGISAWVDAQQRVSAGGAWTVPVEGGIDRALQITEDLDPDAEHLLAVLDIPAEDSPAERRTFVDTTRLGVVADDQWAGTGIAAGALAPLVPDEEAVVGAIPATTFEVEAEVAELAEKPERPSTTIGVNVSLEYADAAGASHSVEVPLRLAEVGDRATASVKVPACADGCRPLVLSFYRVLDPRARSWFDLTPMGLDVERLSLGEADLTAQPWLVSDPLPVLSRMPADPQPYLRPLRTDAGGSWQIWPYPLGGVDLVAANGPELPVLVAGPAPEQVLDPSSQPRVPDVLGRAEVLPFVGTVGVVADLRTATIGARVPIHDSRLVVVANDSTPAALLAELEREAGHDAVPADDTAHAIAVAAGAPVARAHLVVAVAAALVALTALLAAVSRQAREQRRQAAVLRLVHVPAAVVRRSGRIEAAGLAVLATLAVLVGGWLAVRLLLRAQDLLVRPVGGIAPDPSGGLTVWLVALATGAVVLGVAVRARTTRGARTAPATLREEEDR